MGKEGISEIILKEHSNIRYILGEFRLYLDRDAEEAKGFLKQFKEKEINHEFIEEKLIFIFKEKVRKLQIIKKLIEQHSQVMELIKKIEANLGDEEEMIEDLDKLQMFLKEHETLEERKS
mgnify:CR=1 FL=1